MTRPSPSGPRIVRSHGASVSDLERHKARGTVYAAYPEVGYNYRMTDIQGAMGVEQMKKLPLDPGRKQEIGRWYDTHLAAIDEVETPYVPECAVHSYQSYLIHFKPQFSIDRDALLRQMAERGISCRHGIAPDALGAILPAALRGTASADDRKVSLSTMFLPIYPQMSEDELQYVVDNLKDFGSSEMVIVDADMMRV